jgi:site-specific DNA-methyltransferase (adenine-specific)
MVFSGYQDKHEYTSPNGVKSYVYLMDCMEGMKQMDFKADLACVDPPYGIGMAGGKIGNSKTDYKNFSGDDKSIPNKNYYKILNEVSLNQIIWGANYMIEHLSPTSCFIVWDKVQPEDFTMAMCEIAFTSFNSPAKIYKQRIVGADTERIHPTQKPVALYDWIFKNYAKEGQTILDTHLGSQSSRIAAHKAGLSFIGFETDPDYFKQGCSRFADFVTAYEQEIGEEKTLKSQHRLF